MTRVLVTGATGFLGSAICSCLVTMGIDVRAFIRPGSSHPVLDVLPIQRSLGDINDAASLRQAIKGCTTVIHAVLFGRYNRRFWDELHLANALGTQTMLEASRAEQVDRVVVVDTISGFSASRRPVVREANFVPDSRMLSLYPYLHSKMESRKIIERFQNSLTIAIVYCSPIYGPGDKHNHTGRAFQFLYRHKPRMAPPGGTSVVSVADAARACVIAATHPDVPERLVVAAEHLSFIQIFNLILENLSSNHRIKKTLPTWLYWPAFAAATAADYLGNRTPFCPYLIRNGFRFRYFGSEETQSRLGWKPVIPIRDAVAEQAAWMRMTGRLPPM